MPRTLTLKDHFLETRLFSNRAIILLVFSLSLIHISEPTRPRLVSRMPSSA